MRILTKFVSWLSGYYYDECPVCGRYIAVLADGRFVDFCSERAHRKAAEKEKP